VRNRLTKKNILTIPNFMSFFRILLIPMIIWLYCIRCNRYAAVVVIAVSALTDILDGIIARKCNMVSDFGKIIDPIADKLTQATLIICLMTRYRWMGALILLLLIKEGFMLLMGYLTLKRTDTVNSAKWYGKASTVILDAVIMILVLFEKISETAANILILACGLAMLMSLVLYIKFYAGILIQVNSKKKNNNRFLGLWKCVFLLVWAAIILAFIFCQKDISVEKILCFTPANPFFAAIALLALFALKSLSIVIYIGILYAADGILFTLPAAIFLNLCGTAIALSIPYAIGKKIGTEAVDKITEQYPKAEVFKKLRSENDFFFSFIVRLIGILPSDIVSLYMGSIRMPYLKYLTGSMLGFLPRLIMFTVIGMSVADVRSSQFIIAICVEVLSILLSSSLFLIYKKKHKKGN
jgi:CDP-diacylglycerol--glycerol-3-phosphate 3-phosphatidyltransferase